MSPAVVKGPAAMGFLSRLSFRHKILLAFLLANTLGTVCFTIYAYQLQKVLVRRGYTKLLMAGAYAVAERFGDDFHDRIEGPGSVSAAEHLGNSQHLNALAERMRVKYLYALLRVGDTWVFTASGIPPEERGTRMDDPFFSEWKFCPPAVEKGWASMTPGIEEYLDRDVGFRSAFVPWRTPNGRTYLTGCDITLDQIGLKNREVLLQCLLLGAVLFLTTIGVGYPLLSWVGKRLSTLSGFSDTLISSDFSPPAEVQEGIARLAGSDHDEVGRLAGSLLSMREALDGYLQRLTEATTRRERIESELSIARSIQMAMVPRNFPELAARGGCEIFAAMEPAREVGGDFYDLFFLDDHRLFVAIGDVAGKGIPAALFMVMVKTLLKGLARSEAGPEAMLHALNRELSRDNERCMFATILAGIFDTRDGGFTWSNGGHFPPYRLGVNGEIHTEPCDSGFPVGALEEAAFATSRIVLQPREALFFYTDGVTEAMNDRREPFADSRLEDLLRGTPAVPLETLIARVIAGVRTFSAGREPDDDLTLLALRRP